MRIILGVCGSISAYKSLDIARGLVKNGHEVRVILTKGGEKFVRPEVYRYLGCQEVYLAGDDFKYPSEKTDSELIGSVLHVALAKWCDRISIAPLSANFLAKIVRGEAFDLLSSTLLALPKDKPQIFYPAMNTEMLSHPFTKENLEALNKLNNKFPVFVHPTANGLLACGDEGEGKLPSVETIVDTTEAFNKNDKPKKILISTGATKAPLDSVRFLTNSSSGLTGYYLAKTALMAGHIVTVIAGEGSTEKLELLRELPHYSLVIAKTNSDMKLAVESHFKDSDCYISSAAIGDIEFTAENQKLKKEKLEASLPIKKANDILKGVLDLKKPHQRIVGFAAETDLTEEMMLEKFNRKPVDLLVGTKVNNGLTGSEKEGFANEGANYLLLKDNKFSKQSLSKAELANLIIGKVFS